MHGWTPLKLHSMTSPTTSSPSSTTMRVGEKVFINMCTCDKVPRMTQEQTKKTSNREHAKEKEKEKKSKNDNNSNNNANNTIKYNSTTSTKKVSGYIPNANNNDLWGLPEKDQYMTPIFREQIDSLKDRYYTTGNFANV